MITSSTSTFLTIPRIEIDQFLRYYDLPIPRANQEAYELAWNYILDHDNLHLPSIYLEDFVLAYNLQGEDLPRRTTSSILLRPEKELGKLARSLGLPEVISPSGLMGVVVDKARIIRILSYLGLLDNDLSIFATLPEDALNLILDNLECQSLGLICQLSQDFKKKLCDTGKLIGLLRIKIQTLTHLNLAAYTQEELGFLCQVGDRRTRISIGAAHSLVIDSEGQVFSFGINEHGQLGQDDHQSRNVPTLIENQEMGEIISVSVGSNQSLLLNAQGQIFGCGLIAYIPSLNEIWSSDRPVRLESINKLEIGKIIAISTGGNSSNLILNSQGRVFSLKLHEDDETTLESKTSGETFLTWIDISQTGKIAAISAGSFHSLLLNTQGQVFSFGEEGRLGFDDDEPRDSPTLIDTSRLGRIVTISAGESHSLLLNDQGQVYSFGFNNYGQLGVGDQENKLVPTLIENFEMGRVVNISAGYYHSLVLNDRGQVFGFGYNRYGQLGLGDRQNRLIPTLISIEGISAISAGALSSLLLDSQGELFSFGQPGEHLGLGDQPGNGLSPALIKGLIL